MEEGQTRQPESSSQKVIEEVFFSGHVRRLKYDGSTMTITFDNKTVYQYLDVPRSIVDGLLASESRGTYLNQAVKGKYKYRKG